MKRIEAIERTRSKNGEQSLIHYTDRHDPLLIKAIELYQTKYKQKFDNRPSRGKMFDTALLEQNDDVRAIYEQLKKKGSQNAKQTTISTSQPTDNTARPTPSEQF